MNQFESALEKLKAVKGVSCGIVSTADVEAIAANIGIEEPSLSDLYCFLRENGIEVYSEEDAVRLADKTIDQKPNPRIEKFQRADEGLGKLLSNNYVDEQHRQAWINLIEKRETLKVVFVLKQRGCTASEIAAMLQLPIEEVYRREYCICQRLRMVRRARSHNRAKQIKDFYV